MKNLSDDKIPENSLTKGKIRKNRFYRSLPYIITGLVSVVILLAVYAVNGIYPFGDGSVVCDDMVQQTITNYTYFWDYLHSGGSKSILFNWETAAGTQVLTTGFYVLKPWEVIFTLLCSRDGIVNGISFLVIFKITAAALSMVFFLRKEFKIDPFWQIFLSIAYAFSSFIIVYYTNMGWIDAAFMFPFMIVALLHLFRTGKWLPYVLALTYSLLISIYISYMIFMFLFFVGFLYLFLIQPKETRKMSIVRFGVSSVASLAASAAINVPSIYYMFRSTRYEIKSEETTWDSILKILNTSTTYSTTKLTIVLLITSVFLAFFIILCVNFKKHKKPALFFILSLAVLCLPVFFENINLIWHLGSYISFPLRYAYMLIFMLVCASAYVLENMKETVFSLKGKQLIALVIPAVAAAVGGIYVLVTKVYREVGTVSGLKYNKLVVEDCDKWMFLAYMLLAVFYLIFLFVGVKKLSYVLMAGVLVTEIGLLANVSFGTNSQTEGQSAMYSRDFLTDAHEMAEDLNLENDNLSRIKDLDVRLNSNYPMIFNYPSLSNFTHLVSSDMTSTMEALGYSQVYTRVIDSVGTLLSDALLNIKYTFTENELDEYEYTYMYEIGDSHLYANNFTLPVGLIVDEDFVNIDIVENDNVFLSNDELYTALTGDETDIFETDEFMLDTDGDENFEETVHVDGTKHVYLHVDIENTSANRGSMLIMVNGKRVDLTYFGSDVNYYYPNNFHNELIDLGVVTDDDVSVTIAALKSIGEVKITIGYFDSSMLEELCDMNADNCADVETGARSLTATVTCEEDGQYIFLPITYDEGWSCTVNGEEQEIEIALSSFMAIKLTEGENVIELNYLPYGMELGIIITVVTALGLAVVIIIRKKKTIPQDASNTFLKIFEKAYFVLMCVCIALVYIVPMIFTIVNNISG